MSSLHLNVLIRVCYFFLGTELSTRRLLPHLHLKIQLWQRRLKINVLRELGVTQKNSSAIDVLCYMFMSAAKSLIDFSSRSHSQMSNLMNQARLKVLKARDDMIMVRDQCSYLTYMFRSSYSLCVLFIAAIR